MRQRLTFSNVLACVAVFVALGGSAYAAAKINGKDIRRASIGEGKLKPGVLPRTGWFLLNESGDIEAQSGGFRVVSKPGVNEQPATNPNVYVKARKSVMRKGLAAATAIQNTIDRNGDGMPDPSFAGDVSVGACGAEVINCVPAGTEAPDVIVVRALTDNTVVGSPTSRAYVTVTP